MSLPSSFVPANAAIAAQLVTLAELAGVDAKHKVLAEKLDSLPVAAKKADEASAALKKQVDDGLAKKEAAERARKAVETEIIDERHKMKKWEARANDIRGEREHTALLSEIGTAKRVISRLEDTQLEHMEALEQATALVAGLEPKHKAAADAAKAEWRKVEGDMKQLQAELATLDVGRRALLGKLPPIVVKRYDTVAAKRQGVGVSIIRNDTCTSCKLALPPQLCILVRKASVVEQCPSCSRFLVHESMTQAPSEAGTNGAA